MTAQEITSVKQRFGIVGHSERLLHAIGVAIQVAATDMTVLITGESGTGKESFSKIIHQLSVRKHNTFIPINCGAIPEGTIDSELFGHEKGAFTGATDSRKGYFETSDGGTIFLDEIGEMPLGTQARLLRMLESGEFIRVGSSQVHKTDVRVVAATNVNLLEAVQKGKFREDLYYRLSTVPIYVPALRDRGTDAELLFRKFAGDFSERYRTSPVKLTPEAKDMLLKYSWPGNIRQLKNITEQISVLETEDREIGPKKLASYLPAEKSNLPALFRQENSGDVNMSERDLLYKVLFDMRGDVTELKKLVMKILSQGEEDHGQILEEHSELFEKVGTLRPSLPGPAATPHTPEPESPVLIHHQQEKDYVDTDNIEDIVDYDESHDEEEDLNIETLEKELIIKALKKNRNKRKHAAGDLGISERTLYRKIKQYELD